MARKAKAKKSSSNEVTIELPELNDTTILYILIGALLLSNVVNIYFSYQVNNNISEISAVLKSPSGTAAAPEGQPAAAGAPAQQTEEQQDPMSLLSAPARDLINQYGVRGTPTLVINCAKKRIGSYSIAEQRGSLPAGSEQQSLINDLCTIMGDGSVFCADKKDVNATGIRLEDSGEASCAEGSVAKIYVFRSPTCPYCEAQLTDLSALAQKYPNNLKITHVCTPIHGPEDVNLCKTNGGFDLV